MFIFNNKVVVVTGGEKGIGKAIATAFCNRGAKVVIVGIDEVSAQNAIDEIEGDVSFIKIDVTDKLATSKLPDEIYKLYGLTDILVNNAGIHITGDVESTSFTDWKRIMSVNINGVFLMTKSILKHMKEKGKGTIINIASEAGIDAFKNQVAYNVSKAAVIQLTKSLAIDFAENNIRANVVCPGTTMTPLVEKLLQKSDDPDKTKKELEEVRPLNRLGKPDEIAQAVLCLASNELEFATGTVFSIDGGYTAQ